MEKPVARIRQIFASELGQVLSRGASVGFALNLSAAGFGFLLSILFARTMGLKEYGVYVLVVSVLQLLHMLSVFGMDSTMLRFAARYRASEQWSELKGLEIFSQRIVLGVCALLVITIVLGRGFFADLFPGEFIEVLWLALFLLPIWSLLRVKESALRARRLVAYSQVGEYFIRPLLMCLAVFAWLLLSSEPVRASTGIAFSILSSLIVLALVWSWSRRYYPELKQVLAPVFHSKEWVQFGLPVALTVGFFMLIKYTDVLMLGSLVSVESSGIYSAASRFSELTSFGLTAVNLILAPLIAELHTKGNREELQRILTLGVCGSFSFALLVSIALFFLGPLLLSLFGDDFVQGTTALHVLLLGNLINVAIGSVGYLMTMTGNQIEACKVVGLSALCNIVLNAYLIPKYGMLGAAVATSLSMAYWNIALWIKVRRELRVNASIFSLIVSPNKAEEV